MCVEGVFKVAVFKAAVLKVIAVEEYMIPTDVGVTSTVKTVKPPCA